LSSHIMTSAFSLFRCIAKNNLSGSVPTEIGILLDLELLRLPIMDFDGRYSFFGNSAASRIRILVLIICPLLSVNRSQFTNNTIVIHCHDVHFL
jgi:hypothetical protein